MKMHFLLDTLESSLIDFLKFRICLKVIHFTLLQDTLYSHAAHIMLRQKDTYRSIFPFW